ncbi:hypothetical protein GGS20DRAFT_310622 [Poronia punctata]|nr:hypothetical protein GGS20DRAFT_310622 [Poronia punctata]
MEPSQPVPYKPDDYERDRYYYGLAHNPKLVARTSVHRWTAPQHEYGWQATLVQSRKVYLPLTDQKRIMAWTKPLSLELIRVLERCNWCFFFPVRIGLEADAERARTERGERGERAERARVATVLMIGVEPDSLQWDEGVAIALECRGILQRFNIKGVEVEIREGRYTHHNAFAQLESQIEYDVPKYGRTNAAIEPLLPSLGHPIAYQENRRGEGSAGLHLKLGEDESTVYCLTCRHVVDGDRTVQEMYQFSDKNTQYHVRASVTTYSDCLENLERISEDLSEVIAEIEKAMAEWEWYQHDETKKHKRPTEEDEQTLLRSRINKAYVDRITKLVRSLEEKKERTIGCLAFHPRLECSAEEPGYLKDWGLIRLDSAKFSGPKNEVYVGSETPPGRWDHVLNFNEYFRLRLQRNESMEVGPLPVAKRGAASGLTYGTKSGVEAVVRHAFPDGKTAHAWEMLIVGDKGNFSTPGDSGSSVFDLKGNVVGLVVGSTDGKPESTWRGMQLRAVSDPLDLKKHPGEKSDPDTAPITAASELRSLDPGVDVTFASPIQWVLDDIRRFTGLEPRLA